MKRWLALSSSALIVLLILSCAPAAVPTPAPPAPTKPAAIPTPTLAAPAVPASPTAVVSAPIPAKPTPTPTPVAASLTPTPLPAGKYGGVFLKSIDRDPPSMDIHQETSYANVFSTGMAYNHLVYRSPFDFNALVPDLAERWEMSKDGLEWTFYLRKGVKFHDGSELTAEDAAFTVMRLAYPPKGIRATQGALLAVVEKAEEVDRYTVKFRLKNPSPTFLDSLAVWHNAVAQKKAVLARNYDLTNFVMGTGPFKFKSYDPGVKFEMVRHPEYFKKGLPYLDGITTFVIRDKATMMAAFRAKRIYSLGLGGIGLSMGDDKILKDTYGDRVLIRPKTGNSGNMIIFNMKKKVAETPFADQRIRRAIYLALDRWAIAAAQTVAPYQAGDYIVPGLYWTESEEELKTKVPGFRQRDGKKHPDDLAEAKRLLAEAGYPKGLTIPFMVQNRDKIVESGLLVQDQLKETLNINLTIQLVEYAKYFEIAVQGAFDAVVSSHSTPVFDPDGEFLQFVVTGGSRPYPQYSKPEIDALVAEQSRTLEPEKRRAIVQRIVEQLRQEVPYIRLDWETYMTTDWDFVHRPEHKIGLYDNLGFEYTWLDRSKM